MVTSEEMLTGLSRAANACLRGIGNDRREIARSGVPAQVAWVVACEIPGS